MKTTAVFLLLTLLLSSVALAQNNEQISASKATNSDLGKERRWRDQIVDSLMDGDAVDLTADGVNFLGLYTEADEGKAHGAIIVHGIGVHPNWPQVVYPLRTGLPEQGWSTLSVQMPILPNEADDADYAPLMDEVAPRLDAAVAYLKKQGVEKVTIIAHSLGATMANDYLANHPDAAIAFVAIGMSSGGKHAGRDNTELLGKVRVPVLDLFGQNDLESVVSGAATRAAAASGNPDYHQVQVPGADHFFDGYEDELTSIVEQWLDELDQSF